MPFAFLPIKSYLKPLADIIKGILSLYVYAEYSLKDILKQNSLAAYYSLLFLYNKFDSALMPTVLYHDLQATFLDTFYSVCKAKHYFPNEPLYIVLNGTDPVERFNGTTRNQQNLGKNTTAMDLLNAARSIAACDQILLQNPELVSKSKVQSRLALDYSNPRSWSADLTAANFDPKSVWLSGYYTAIAYLGESGIVTEDHRCDMKEEGYTIRRPIGTKTGGTEFGITTFEADEPEQEIPSETQLPASTQTVEEDIAMDEAMSEIQVASAHCPFLHYGNGEKIYKHTACR